MGIKTLLENAVLNPETKQVVQEAFETALKAKETQLDEEYKNRYEADLLESTAQIRSAVNASMQEVIEEEMQAISEELKHSRTLEVQYAEKLEDFKGKYAEKIEEQMQIAVAEAVVEEMDVIKEDIELAKKHEFVMQMFESYKDTYERLFGQSDVSIYDELKEAKSQLDAMQRKVIMADLLESVKGDKRKVAQTILESTATDKLEDKFESIKSFLVAESVSEEEDKTTVQESDKKDIGRIVLENLEDKGGEKKIDPVLARLEQSLKFVR